MKKHVGALCTLALLSGSATQSIRATKSAFPTGRSHGSSSGDPGPNYSADFSAIGSQSAGRPA